MNETSKEPVAATSAHIEAWLTMQNVPGSPWAYAIETEPLTIGRSRGCAIRVIHRAVSREHAAVWQDDGRLHIRDLHSTNGTRVNGSLIHERELVPGDLIQVGDVVLRVCGPPDFKPSLDASGEHGSAIATDLDEYTPSAVTTSFSPAIPEEEEHLVGGAALDPVREFIRRASAVDANVLILGETGTGKELVARAIHRHSTRANGPFVARNCGAFPESLLTNELFGHEPGAFTGATKLQKGVFDQADGGTLLLDEIAEIPLTQQTKLLRVVEERSFQRVGGQEPVRVDVRLIAATNSDLAQAVADGKFRRDLYYRLQVLGIRLPTLRGRPGDIHLLTEHFVRLECDRWGLPVLELSREALRRLEMHDWPGNVRELRHTMDRAIILSQGSSRIESEHILLTASPDHQRGSQVRLDEREREHILQVIAGVGGNKTKAAAMLGIDRSTLLRKLQRLHEAPVKGC